MRNLFLIVLAVVLVGAMANAQTTATAAEYYTVGVAGDVTFTTTAPGQLDNLSKGYTYTLNPDQYVFTASGVPGGQSDGTGVVTPSINGGEAGVPMNFVLQVTGAGSVAVSFELPSVLTGSQQGFTNSPGSVSSAGSPGTATEDFIRCSFSPTSLFRDQTADGLTTANGTGGASYNPNVTNVFNLNDGGADAGQVTLWLGITVTVPANAISDVYQGVVACSAIITGL
ncbi:MAG TPA: hypothetical protein VKS81_04435 [Bacteroidota bacterium]|nr:hypothetical protein [Bacteroidota bacterium]